MTEKELLTAAKAELNEYRKLLDETKAYHNKVAEVRAFAQRTTRAFTGMPNGSGVVLPGAQVVVERLEHLAVEWEQAAKQMHEQTIRIIRTLQRVQNPVYRELLRLHYVEGKSLKAACTTADRSGKLHYSYDWVRHLHRKALIAYGKAMLQVK